MRPIARHFPPIPAIRFGQLTQTVGNDLPEVTQFLNTDPALQQLVRELETKDQNINIQRVHRDQIKTMIPETLQPAVNEAFERLPATTVILQVNAVSRRAPFVTKPILTLMGDATGVTQSIKTELCRELMGFKQKLQAKLN